MSLSTQVMTGLGLGLLTGVFFGEEVAFFQTPGQAFVLLLQMTVIPYVVVSLVGGLGRLGAEGARSLARNAGGFLLGIWAVSLAAVLLMPLAFPSWEAASFFSRGLVEGGEDVDFLELYIPANPFHSLASGVVPAVVVFSAAIGIGLIATDPKQALLESLSALEDTLLRVTNGVVRLAPYGVFAIAAGAAGTLDVESFRGLQVYAAVYAGLASVLALYVLPGLVTMLTPFRYSQLLGPSRDALVTAFATGSVFVVLPILAARSKELLDSVSDADGEAHRVIDVIVPISFTLSSAGKLLSLGFVLFAGWLSGFPLSATQYPGFVFTGIFSFFASTFVGVPFLLDLYRIPADTFELFVIADNVVGNRFGAALAAVHILVLAVLTASAAAGLVTVKGRKIVGWAAISLALTAITIGGVRVLFESIERPYEGYENFVQRGLLLPPAPSGRVGIPTGADARGPTLERIRRSRTLRVGFEKDSLPHVFRNETGERVGFDVEMAHALARDLGVAVEFVELDLKGAAAMLEAGAVDVLMTAVPITPDTLRSMSFSDPYLEETLAFVVLDHRRSEFSSREAVRAHESLRLAIPGTGYYAGKARQYLPQAELVPVKSVRDFFRGAPEDLDGLIFTAQAGSAWTLIYPEFSVAIPHPDLLSVPLGYGVVRGDLEMTGFLDAWIDLKRRDGTIERLYDYWIEGRLPPGSQRRWSILRDVLGWGRPPSEDRG